MIEGEEEKEQLPGEETTRTLVERLGYIYTELKEQVQAKTVEKLCKALTSFKNIDNSSLMTLIKHIPNFEILHKEIQEHLIKNLENEELLAFIETFDFSEEHIAEYYNQAFEHLIPPEVKETAEKLIEKNDAESMKKEILIFIAQTYVSSDNKGKTLVLKTKEGKKRKIKLPIKTKRSILSIIEFFQDVQKRTGKKNRSKLSRITVGALLFGLGLGIGLYTLKQRGKKNPD